VAGDEQPARARLSRFASHPAVLLLLTACVTAGLVPWITNRWEQRDKAVEAVRVQKEKELDVKTALVRQMGVSSARFLADVETLDPTRAPGGLNAAYSAFEQASFDIRSQLAAYFPESALPRRWDDFAYSIRNTYTLLRARPGRERNPSLVLLSQAFKIPPVTIDGLCFAAGEPDYVEDLGELIVRFAKREAFLVRAVIAGRFGAPVSQAEASEPTSPRRRLVASDPRHPCNRYFSK
jgi:hypothetical protein